jgi:hypothetical protein
MQQCVRVDRTLEKGLTDSGGVTLAMMRSRELVELVLQTGKRGIEVSSLAHKLSAGLSFSTQIAEDETAPQRAQPSQINGTSHGFGSSSAAGPPSSRVLSGIAGVNSPDRNRADVASLSPSCCIYATHIFSPKGQLRPLILKMFIPQPKMLREGEMSILEPSQYMKNIKTLSKGGLEDAQDAHFSLYEHLPCFCGCG